MIDYTLCKVCKNRSFSSREGIICGLTNAKPSFIGKCQDFSQTEDNKDINKSSFTRSKSQFSDELSKWLFSYLVFIVLGVSILVVGAFIDLGRTGNGVLKLTAFCSMLLGNIFSLKLLYRAWKFVLNQAKYYQLDLNVKSAGQAIGFLFIPFFNLYWVFVVYPRLATSLNAIGEERGSYYRIDVIIPYLIGVFTILSLVPLLGLLIGLLNWVVFIPLFLHIVIKTIQNLPPPALEQIKENAFVNEPVDSEQVCLRDVNDYSELFNLKKYGWNYQLVALITAAGFLSLLFTRLIYFGFRNFSDNFLDALYIIPLAAIKAFIIVAVSYWVRNKVVVSLVSASIYTISTLLYLFAIYFFNPFLFENLNDLYGLIYFVRQFVFGFLYMYLIILSINFTGVRFWSLLIAGFVLYFAFYFYDSIASEYAYKFRIKEVIVPIINSLIQALAFYYGFVLGVRPKNRASIILF